jgi:hypothetical protein
MKKNTKRMLVFAGTAIMGIAYIPEPKPAPTREFISRTYVRATREQKWQASERRKQELQNNVIAARIQLRMKARNPKATVGYNYGTIAIHSHNLIDNILNRKA